MTLSRYILFMLLIMIIAWVLWVVVIYQIDPTAAGFLGFVFFYLTMAFALITTFATLGLIFRRLFVRQIEPQKQVVMALRQGVMLTLLVIVSLILLSLNLLTWWNAGLLLLLLAVVEFFFLSYQYKQ